MHRRLQLFYFLFCLFLFSGPSQADRERILGTYWFPDKTGQVEVFVRDGGTIYDASEGKTYKAKPYKVKLWFDDGNLKILKDRGYVGIPMFGRTWRFNAWNSPVALGYWSSPTQSSNPTPHHHTFPS